MEGDLRVVGAGLDAEVAAASAPGRARRRRTRGSVGERRRPRAAEAEAVASNSVGPKPNVTVSRPAAGRAPRRCRRRRQQVAGSPSPTGSPAVIARPPSSTRAAGRAARPASRRDDVERGEVQPVLRRRGDAGLVRAVERDRRCASPPSPPAAARRRRRRRAAARGQAAAPRRPASSRRESAPRACAQPRRRRRSPRPGERLGERVDRAAEERVCRPASSSCRRRSRSPARYGCERRARRRRSAASISFASAGSPARQRPGANGSNAAFGALDVRLEVDEVGVRVALLLAGDLRPGHLAEELDGAVRDLRRLELDRLHAPLQRRRRRPSACRRACAVPGSCLVTQSACSIGWKPVHFAFGDVAGAGVDRRVEVAEALGHRLDPLVGDARGRVQRLRALRRRRPSARCDERRGPRDEQRRSGAST